LLIPSLIRVAPHWAGSFFPRRKSHRPVLRKLFIASHI
jgi:hypothetical protein